MFAPKLEPKVDKPIHIPERPDKSTFLQLRRGIGFDKWIFPIIKRMPEGGLLDQLIAVQPMQEPPAERALNGLLFDLTSRLASNQQPHQ